MNIYTIGFSKKNLRQFIELIRKAEINKIIDVRLNNTSQLAGYAKKDDLKFILEIFNIEYEHIPELAPTEKLLKDFKNKNISWEDYEKEFKQILQKNNPATFIEIQDGQNICLLCSEDKPNYCHRRLIAEALIETYPELKIIHL